MQSQAGVKCTSSIHDFTPGVALEPPFNMGFKTMHEKGHQRKESRRYDNIGSHMKDSVIGEPLGAGEFPSKTV